MALTDWLQGTAGIIGITIGIFAYLSGRVDFSDYLNIMYIPNLSELVIFCTAFVGACLGFLWYNAYPAQVFMGDTGSLTLGGVIAVLALAVRKELLIPVICGIFLIENLSVIIQVAYFKYTKKKYGEGRRIFLMSPLHHHYQKKGIHESKIVTRFWIVGISAGHFFTRNPETAMKQRVAILGAGESGTGAALLAKAKGFEVFVSDQGSLKINTEMTLFAIRSNSKS
jgi:phospho-N-acetylmuramoyl-pentapeptide-transferase